MCSKSRRACVALKQQTAKKVRVEAQLPHCWMITQQGYACSACSLRPVKDIHDLDGVHGNGFKHAAVTLVVHHHHEEVAAGDLLDHKGPVRERENHRCKRDKCQRILTTSAESAGHTSG